MLCTGEHVISCNRRNAEAEARSAQNATTLDAETWTFGKRRANAAPRPPSLAPISSSF
jgi:hypothetical protein